MPSAGQPDAVARGTQNSPLPPSVETAYYRKCIELKRRINEIEDNNDAARLRKVRINRQILKMRLERAFLLEQLQKRMDYNIDESDRSSSPPPTPQDKPLRSKRAHAKRTPPPQAGPSAATPNSSVILPAPSVGSGPHPPHEHSHSYFDSTPGAQPAGLVPVQPSAPGSLPPGSFRPIEPLPAAQLSHGTYRNGPHEVTPEEISRLQHGGVERYDGADEREEDDEHRTSLEARDEARGETANGSTDRPMDGESKDPPQASSSSFTAVNR